MEQTNKQHSFVAGRLSAMMFLEFFIWGAWYVTVGNYMAAHGMGAVIGWAYSVGPIAAIVSPFFLGMIADRFFATERVLGVLHVVGGVAMICAPFAASALGPTAFILVLLVHMLCYMPTLGLTNSLAFHNLTDREKHFPLIRVFGTIGWIVANVIVSLLLKADKSALQFYVTGGVAVLMGIYSFTLPHTPPPAKGKGISLRDVLGLDSLSMLRDRNYLVFIACSLLICMPLAAYYNYAPVFVSTAGSETPAFHMSFGQMAEIVFMLLMPLLFVRLGVKWMLGVGMLAWVTRYGLFALGAPDAVWWMIMTGIALHGICYDFFFVAGFIYCDQKADVKIRAQAQGLLVLVTQGIGMLVGAQVSQLLVNRIVTKELLEPPKLAKTLTALARATRIDNWRVEALLRWQSFWIIPCIAAAVVLVVFIILFRQHAGAAAAKAKEETQTEGAGE